MKLLILVSVLAAPFVIGSVAVGNTEGSANFLIVLFFSFLMFREALKICLLLMYRWRMIEQMPALAPMIAPLFNDSELRPAPVRKRNIYRRDIYNRW